MRLHNDVDVISCDDRDGDTKGEWSAEIPNCIRMLLEPQLYIYIIENVHMVD